MTTALEVKLQRAARRFAEEIVEILKHASVADLASIAGVSGKLAGAASNTGTRRGPKARAARRDGKSNVGPTERTTRTRERRGTKAATLAPRVLAALGASASGLNSEALRAKLGSPERPAYQYAMTKLLAEGKVVKTGERRGTLYRLA